MLQAVAKPRSGLAAGLVEALASAVVPGVVKARGILAMSGPRRATSVTLASTSTRAVDLRERPGKQKVEWRKFCCTEATAFCSGTLSCHCR